jgi:asparagine synthase (glutamine-hydrolysing)
MFEQENAGVMHHAVEIRYPFLDLRIVEYLLGLPPFPWFFQKMLLRESMAGRLPERVRTRRKTPMQGDPIAAQFRKTGGELPKQMRWDTNVDQYINRSEMVVPHGNMDTEQLSSALRPYCLNYWLKSAGRIRHETVAETGNGKAR